MPKPAQPITFTESYIIRPCAVSHASRTQHGVFGTGDQRIKIGTLEECKAYCQRMQLTYTVLGRAY